MVVKLPEVNFFLQKSASDIFPCSRNIQISKIHATPSPRDNTPIIIKLENFKLSRPNLQWEKEYRYFIIVGISVFVGRGQKKIEVCDCKELRCYFFSSKFCIGFFPVFQKGQNFKNYRDTISRKKLGWNINFKNGQIWVIIGMVEKKENFCGRSFQP